MLKNNNKASGLILDVDDLNLLSDRVIEELKNQHHDEMEQHIVELKILDDDIKKVSSELNLDES